ncbi:glycerate kinase [Cellulomonas sp. HZM]|uniref:glycerate kinase family protein n=1 Tax=Cellulomonas sp. HZM TaxID=1454010 RepID=UPI0004935486|nr:glycerate kinase [Cellulomonas sp. HZM]
MHVLLAPDSFGTSLTAREAAAELAAGWSAGAPGDEITVRPLSDGGPGFVEVVHAALGGTLEAATVTGPLHAPVPAAVLRVGSTAYVESAHAVGLGLVPADRRDPGRTTSRGVGELVDLAVRGGARRVVVGLGGSSTNDAGAGALVGLGLDVPALALGGAGLGEVRAAELRGLRALRERLGGVELVVAADVDVPLLGLQGASAGFAPQKGATPEQAQELERSLASFARAAVDALGDALRPDLIDGTQPVRRLTTAPGAGAAGGLGFGLQLVGARLVPGAAFVADAVGLDDLVRSSDVVVTGEGRFDWQSLHGKATNEVATRALRHGVPVVVVAGQVLVGRRELAAAGITASYAVAEAPDEVAAALADAAGSLRRRTERVARTWSR